MRVTGPRPVRVRGGACCRQQRCADSPRHALQLVAVGHAVQSARSVRDVRPASVAAALTKPLVPRRVVRFDLDKHPEPPLKVRMPPWISQKVVPIVVVTVGERLPHREVPKGNALGHKLVVPEFAIDGRTVFTRPSACRHSVAGFLFVIAFVFFNIVVVVPQVVVAQVLNAMVGGPPRGRR